MRMTTRRPIRHLLTAMALVPMSLSAYLFEEDPLDGARLSWDYDGQQPTAYFSNGDLEYRFITAGIYAIPNEDFKWAIVNAFQTWEDSPDAEITFVRGPPIVVAPWKTEFSVGFTDGSGNMHFGGNILGAAAVTIFSYNPTTDSLTDADISFNRNPPFATWSVDGSTSSDLEVTALHEAGHSHGLAHPPHVQSSMSYVGPSTGLTTSGTEGRRLTEDDHIAIALNYPSDARAIGSRTIAGTIKQGANNFHQAQIGLFDSSGLLITTTLSNLGQFRVDGLQPDTYTLRAFPSLSSPSGLYQREEFLPWTSTAPSSFTTTSTNDLSINLTSGDNLAAAISVSTGTPSMRCTWTVRFASPTWLFFGKVLHLRRGETGRIGVSGPNLPNSDAQLVEFTVTGPVADITLSNVGFSGTFASSNAPSNDFPTSGDRTIAYDFTVAADADLGSRGLILRNDSGERNLVFGIIDIYDDGALTASAANNPPAGSVTASQVDKIMIGVQLTTDTIEPVRVRSWTIANAGTGSTLNVTAVNIYHDANSDGDIDSGEAHVGTGTFSSPALIRSAHTIAVNSSQNFLVTYTFSADVANADTFQATLTDMDVWGVNSAQSLTESGLTIAGNVQSKDSTPPTITCPTDITINCDQSTAPVTTGSAIATDSIDPNPAISFGDSNAAGSRTQESAITRTWTASDTCGNSASCQQNITIGDTTNPLITCPADATIECDANSSSVATAVATATNNCDADPSITEADSVTPSACLQESTITRTWTATDACANSSSCLQAITIEDSTVPVITCPAAVTIECDESTGLSNTGNATATDNCDLLADISFSDSGAAGTCPQEQVITRAWAATDDCGNSSSCSQIIIVVDSTPPVLTGVPADVTVACDAAVPPAANVTANDSCDPVVTPDFAESRINGNCQQIYTLKRIWDARDDCDNTASATQMVTVVDTTPPIARCRNITIALDATDAATITPTQIDNGSTDNCSTFTLGVAPGTCGCADVPLKAVTLTVTDACGNNSTCNAQVTVQDNTPPAITCPADVTITCGQSTNPAQTGGTTATDVCDPTPNVTFNDSATGGTCGQGTTITRTWTATDAFGNSSQCNQTTTFVLNSIAGDITYAGRQLLTRFFAQAFDNEQFTGDPVQTDGPIAPGRALYEIDELPAATYFVRAFLDSDTDGLLGATEAVGFFAPHQFGVNLPPDAENIDMTLVDSDIDQDNLPDWWEVHNFVNIAEYDDSSDPDNDGRNNGLEFDQDTDPNRWDFVLSANDPPRDAQIATLTLGMLVGADDGFNDEDTLAPAGAGNELVIRFDTEPGLQIDIRSVADEAEWILSASPGPGRQQTLLTWDGSLVPTDRVLLLQEVDGAVRGNPVDDGPKIDMAQTTALLLEDNEQRFFQIRFIARTTQTISFQEGWNQFAICLIPDDSSVEQLFGSVLLSGIWALDNPSQNYIDIADVVSLQGYWGFRQIGSGPAQLQIDGRPLLFAGRHVQLDVDWNVKGPADTIDRLDGKLPIDRNIYFWDDSDYFIVPADGQMEKGRAYWIHIESGSINVNTSPFK